MSIRIIILSIFIIGIGILSYSFTLPYYKNQKEADYLLNNSYNIDKQEFYKQDKELRTNKVVLLDLGAGITSTSGIIFIFLLLTKTKNISDLKKLKSFNKWTTLLSANLVWLLLIPGTFWYYTYRSSRGDYPPFADSIGIPIYTQMFAILFLIIPLNIFILLTTIETKLPTELFMKANRYNRYTVLWELFFVFFGGINFYCLFIFISDGDHISIAVNLFFLFLLLSLRSGQINKYNQKNKHNF